MDPAQRPHLVIIGGGFAGLWAARALAGSALAITLVDRANHHLFQPLLYQVATAGLSAGDIAAPLRHILRGQRNIEVRMAEVTAIDTAARRVQTSDGAALVYDYLLVASGATHAYFGHDEWAAHAPGLKTLDDALEMRRRILLAFEHAEVATSAAERDAWLTFAVVGGGPTGVELAGTLAEIARHTLQNEFRRIDPARARVQLIEAGPRAAGDVPARAVRARARRSCAAWASRCCFGAPVQAIDDAGLRPRWRAHRGAHRAVGRRRGGLAARACAMLGAALDRAGRVLVEPDLSVPGHPEIFVDRRPGRRQAAAAASRCPASRPRPSRWARMWPRPSAAPPGRRSSAPFRYLDYGNLATIGRMAAVVDLRGLRISGLLAWWFWLFAHVFFLIGFRNRLVVLTNWAWAYWTYQRQARVVLGGARARP